MRAGKGDMDATSELKKVTESMGKKVENACLKVLKEELSEVQNWVEAEQ
jgi:ribosomal protein L12E/L44/L45/RPP1/RPP2